MMDQENWVQDYMSKDPDLDVIWDNRFHPPPNNHAALLPNNMQTGSSGGFVTDAIHQPLLFGQPSARDLLNDSNWALQYDPSHDAIGAGHLEKTELMLTASEFLKSVSDPKIKATEFMNYVEKLSSGEIGADGQRTEARSEQWASEYENEISAAEMQARRNGSWAEEYVTGNGAVGGAGIQEGVNENFWQKLNNEWENMAKDDLITHPWLSGPSASKVNEVSIFPITLVNKSIFYSLICCCCLTCSRINFLKRILLRTMKIRWKKGNEDF